MIGDRAEFSNGFLAASRRMWWRGRHVVAPDARALSDVVDESSLEMNDNEFCQRCVRWTDEKENERRKHNWRKRSTFSCASNRTDKDERRPMILLPSTIVFNDETQQTIHHVSLDGHSWRKNTLQQRERNRQTVERFSLIGRDEQDKSFCYWLCWFVRIKQTDWLQQY